MNGVLKDWNILPSPSEKKPLQETWRELELLLDQEKIRSVGVSNFQVSDLEELIGGFHLHIFGISFHLPLQF